MEFLVTMTTTVPAGTPEAEVDDVRAREAANSARLAEEGSLLRLWRPPLQPGEWRSLGLFEAPDAKWLEETLAGMPLRIWRSDEVTPLAPHPNDPGPAASDGGADSPEFFVLFVVDPAKGGPADAFKEATAAEAVRTRELAAEGHLARLWRLPGDGRALGLWRAGSPEEMRDILGTLPLTPWLTTETTPLTAHPSDPASRP
ncbi:muconolactone Delta-isomerase family protein [Phaeacidiphilus oryzae]|uniref:muconolactone Delta-isomerase family protein n=1 Tax=Phaeacidiphilus oryzae TaxID=348818 RepID=UPI000564C007|nr:muconolactone Delta-isomerase family protein [Phaeacidiphilus oryzae]